MPIPHPSDSRKFQPPGSYTFHPFADGAALHRTGNHRLWVLNASSAVLWCLLEEIGAGAGLAQAYAEHFAIPLAQAKTDVAQGLESFTAAGLFSDLSAEESQNTPQQPPDNCQLSTESLAPSAWRKRYRLAGLSWQIGCADAELADRWFAAYAHLEADDEQPQLCFALEKKSAGWQLWRDGALLQTGLQPDQLLPWLLTELFDKLCAAQQQKLLLHAAVLVKQGSALLLPAESGSGKSTLSMALAAHGYTVASDELCPIDPVTLQVAPFPLPVGIKSRSLQALETFYPDLASRPAYDRADGLQVRYLGVDDLPLESPSAGPWPATRLVFPRYQPGAEAGLQRLEPLAALELLARTGSSERPLEAQDVQALLTLAGERPCFQLSYGELSAAIALLERDGSLDG